MRFIASFRISPFSCPGKRKLVLTPHITCATMLFRSSNVGCLTLRVRCEMSYLHLLLANVSWHISSFHTHSASLSIQRVMSLFSTNWCIDSSALYGSTTVSDT